ncbi:MAG: FAD:protein FMN transferase [Candidatus Absconditabacteria bacterium]|nr:FAD:protein FMN transferase [Candidatus Absconditabacteria bacterium]MDD3868430.1 FAD:protein FMN transferase [Candidatus Absconditabacteria bacterium]MDD4714046.1 FAD:protein FMN transferase [Candidatus Absconditabacteria bacterium]
MIYTKELFGSTLSLSLSEEREEQESKSVAEECFSIAKEFEEKYSRFIPGNFLDELNTQKSAPLDEELRTLLELAKTVSKRSKGYFDITISPLLENAGYGIHKTPMPEQRGYQNIKLTENKVILENNSNIELGAIGKGYMVDKIYKKLDPLFENFIINFGGDIKVKGSHTLLLEDPLNPQKSIGNIQLTNHAIASSSGQKRKLKNGHHLINPKTKRSQNDKLSIFVTHPLATFADVFSTALFVMPIEESLELLKETPSLQALIIDQKGKIYQTKNFIGILHTHDQKR